MQYAIYLRKSRADMEAEQHGEGETLARHESVLIALANKLNISITKIYREVVSGETITSRPEIQKLLSEVEQGIYSGVLVVDIDRLARGDTIDQGIIARAFTLSNTKIITPTKTYDPSNEFDEEYFEFSLFMSRREYKTISRRIQRGRIASVKEGKYIGSTAPYGYDRIKLTNGKGYTLQPNSEADAIKLIYKLYLEGNGMTIIGNILDDSNIKPRNNEYWSKCSIADILKNPVYIGKIRWSYRPDIKKSVDGKVVKTRVKNSNAILVDGIHEPIIDVDIFNAVQKRISERKKMPIKQATPLQNPYTGLIYCGICGNKMTRLAKNKRNKYDTIKCTNKNCNCVSAPIYLVEEQLLLSLKSWLAEYKFKLKNDSQKNIVDPQYDLNENQLKECELNIKKITDQINKTYDLLEQNIYTIDVFTERNKTLSEQRQKLEQKAEKIKSLIQKDKASQVMKIKILPLWHSVIESYQKSISAEEKNELLKSILLKIEYTKITPNTRGNLENKNFELLVYPIINE